MVLLSRQQRKTEESRQSGSGVRVRFVSCIIRVNVCFYSWALAELSSRKQMMYLKIALLLAVGLQLCSSCDMDQTRHGCRIQNKVCSCGFGCTSEYRYDNMAECQHALKGKRQNVCFPNPCLNGGSCSQISQQPGYKCKCDGTSYFGARCNRACPSADGDKFIPHECIVI